MEGLTDSEKRRLGKEYRERLDDYRNLQAAVTAVSLTAMRRRICDKTLNIHLPDSRQDADTEITPIAHVLIGGATSDFSGVMPGIFEEALYAFQAEKPVFIIAACGGAAAVLSTRLLELAQPENVVEPKLTAPPEFTAGHYGKQEKFSRMLQGIKHPAITCNPNDSFSDLWSKLREVHDATSLAKLLNNGLNGAENIALLEATSFLTICDLIGEGISRRANSEQQPTEKLLPS